MLQLLHLRLLLLPMMLMLMLLLIPLLLLMMMMLLMLKPRLLLRSLSWLWEQPTEAPPQDQGATRVRVMLCQSRL